MEESESVIIHNISHTVKALSNGISM